MGMSQEEYQERYEPADQERVTLVQLQAAVDTAVQEAVAGPYMERADVLALVAALLPAVVAPVALADPAWKQFQEMGFEPSRCRVLYLEVGGRRWTWHLTPDQAGLFAGVEEVALDDPRAQYDGHTTQEKYEGIRAFVARIAPAMDRRSA